MQIPLLYGVVFNDLWKLFLEPQMNLVYDLCS